MTRLLFVSAGDEDAALVDKLRLRNRWNINFGS